MMRMHFLLCPQLLPFQKDEAKAKVLLGEVTLFKESLQGPEA